MRNVTMFSFKIPTRIEFGGDRNMSTMLAVGLVVLITHALEGITGFGCTVLALPFVAWLVGIKTAVPTLVVLAWVLAGYIVWRSRQAIVWKEYFFIAGHAVVGLPLGIMLFDVLPEATLKLVLSCFMMYVGARGMVTTCGAGGLLPVGLVTVPGGGAAPRRGLLARGVLACGGVIHGAFGAGGPLVVIYAADALKDKTLFRVTLCLLWLTLNTILIIRWTVTGGALWSPSTLKCLMMSLPFLVTGMLLGDWLHHKVDEKVFRLFVYGALAAAGGAMAVGSLS